MLPKSIYNTVWKIEHGKPQMRLSSRGSPVEANSPVVIEHCATAHLLASDKLQYRNDFGMENEVNVHSYSTANKSQALKLEQVGKLTRDEPTKFANEQNIWMICTAKDQKLAEPIPEPPKYTA